MTADPLAPREHPPMKPWDHSDANRPAVWVPGFGACICRWCNDKRKAALATLTPQETER